MQRRPAVKILSALHILWITVSLHTYVPSREAVLKRRAKVLFISPHCQAALTITASKQRECRPPL